MKKNRIITIGESLIIKYLILTLAFTFFSIFEYFKILLIILIRKSILKINITRLIDNQGIILNEFILTNKIKIYRTADIENVTHKTSLKGTSIIHIIFSNGEIINIASSDYKYLMNIVDRNESEESELNIIQRTVINENTKNQKILFFYLIFLSFLSTGIEYWICIQKGKFELINVINFLTIPILFSIHFRKIKKLNN